jgi:hypothetical protein
MKKDGAILARAPEENRLPYKQFIRMYLPTVLGKNLAIANSAEEGSPVHTFTNTKL